MSLRPILVVDDDPDIVTILEVILADWHLPTISATTGEMALDRVRAGKPRLILLDLHLPGRIDGLEVLRRLKADPQTRNIPVIVVSAFAMETSEQDVLKAGAAGALCKPFSLADLRRLLNKHLKRKTQD